MCKMLNLQWLHDHCFDSQELFSQQHENESMINMDQLNSERSKDDDDVFDKGEEVINKSGMKEGWKTGV